MVFRHRLCWGNTRVGSEVLTMSCWGLWLKKVENHWLWKQLNRLKNRNVLFEKGMRFSAMCIILHIFFHFFIAWIFWVYIWYGKFKLWLFALFVVTENCFLCPLKLTIMFLLSFCSNWNRDKIFNKKSEKGILACSYFHRSLFVVILGPKNSQKIKADVETTLVFRDVRQQLFMQHGLKYIRNKCIRFEMIPNRRCPFNHNE